MELKDREKVLMNDELKGGFALLWPGPLCKGDDRKCVG